MTRPQKLTGNSRKQRGRSFEGRNGPGAHVTAALPSTEAFDLRFCDRGDRVETGWVVHGQIGENLAIDDDFGLAETSDESGIRQTNEAGRSIDPNNPQAAKFTLFSGSVAGGVVECTLHGLIRPLVTILPPTSVPFGQLENRISSATSFDAFLDAHDLVRSVGEKFLDDLLRIHVAQKARAAIASAAIH